MADYDLQVFLEPPLTFLTQKHGHRPWAEGSRMGDCWRTNIACLIGAKDPEEVPHFVEIQHSTGDEDFEEMRLAREWLRARNLDLAAVNIGEAWRLGVPYLASVPSQTGPWRHSVIACMEEVIHDPSGVGGYTIEDADVVVEVLVQPYTPEPGEMVRRWRKIKKKAQLYDVTLIGGL